jgi:hypothetical protein
MILLRAGILILFLIVATSYGQITIVQGDLLGLIGESHTIEGDGSESIITVDVGSAGANQMWDFSGITFDDPLELTLEFVSPGDTPFTSDFPTSNLAYVIPFNEFGFSGVGYNYIDVQSNQVNSLGFAAELTDPDSTIIDRSDEELVPLPMTYGDSWTSSNVDTFEIIPGFGTITIEMLETTVDAYGTIKLKAGEFECLRIRDEKEEIILSLVGGEVAFADTSTSINYSWIGKESFLLAEVGSMDGEDNPIFTQAEDVQLTSNTGSANALSDNGIAVLPKGMILHANYPNPFNPSTTIKFDIPQAGNVQLVIYDLNGRRISTLIDDNLAAGSHQVSWNGLDASGITVSSGVYIYRLQSMGTVLSRKLTLLR